MQCVKYRSRIAHTHIMHTAKTISKIRALLSCTPLNIENGYIVHREHHQEIYMTIMKTETISSKWFPYIFYYNFSIFCKYTIHLCEECKFFPVSYFYPSPFYIAKLIVCAQQNKIIPFVIILRKLRNFCFNHISFAHILVHVSLQKWIKLAQKR